ncbi:MAG: glycosyltransferase family 39 protein [Nanoarchaeota archaeon]
MAETKSIFQNKLNLILVGIILFGTIIRFYFFNLVKNQAHWWDSLAYGSLAKNMIYHRWDNLPFIMHEAVIRPPLLPVVWSWLISLGASDYAVIILTNIIPSIISIYLIYLIGKEMYNKKVGLVAAIFASISWIHLFYSIRIMTDIPSMCLVLASIYFFVKSYESLNLKNWLFSVLLLSLAVLFRYSHAVMAVAYIIFLIFVHKTSLFKSKKFWIGGIIGAIPLILFILINLFAYGSLLPATSEYTSSASEKTSFGWYTIGFINYILMSPAVFLFYFGILLALFKVGMSYGFISKHKELRMHLLNLILLIFVLSFFIFGIKASEDRYLLGISSVLFIMPAVALLYLYKIISKYKKEIGVAVCIALIAWSIYAQISFANGLILDKKESYKEMKEAYEWIKYNTPEEAIIVGDWGEPYAIYYADRDVQIWPEDLDFSNFTLEADYVILTAVHQPNEKVVSYVNDLAENEIVIPIKVFFFDSAQTQPAVIIYKKL